MSYVFYFLLGIPIWLIPAGAMLRDRGVALNQRVIWAAMAFTFPFAIFGGGAIGQLLAQQQLALDAPSLRAIGYFVVLLNVVAFVSPFILQLAFRAGRARSLECSDVRPIHQRRRL